MTRVALNKQLHESAGSSPGPRGAKAPAPQCLLRSAIAPRCSALWNKDDERDDLASRPPSDSVVPAGSAPGRLQAALFPEVLTQFLCRGPWAWVFLFKRSPDHCHGSQVGTKKAKDGSHCQRCRLSQPRAGPWVLTMDPGSVARPGRGQLLSQQQSSGTFSDQGAVPQGARVLIKDTLPTRSPGPSLPQAS